ncbi:hypothetical protein HZU77_012060 [Neisseriaceae bacterium TC5R-5]|nr:hypothetical protein [Neisseriaceae bacterium TC5R-5]
MHELNTHFSSKLDAQEVCDLSIEEIDNVGGGWIGAAIGAGVALAIAAWDAGYTFGRDLANR